MRPTRLGRETPQRSGLVYVGIGVDPDLITEDPEPPTDRASEGLAYVPFVSQGEAALVQSDTEAGLGFVAITLTLPSAPTIGNLLVICVAINDDNGPSFTLNNGTWTQVNSDVFSGNGTNWPNRMYYQVVNAGTSASTTITPSGGIGIGAVRGAILELSGVDSLDPDTGSASNTASTTDSVTPSAGVPAVLVSGTFSRGSNPSLSPAGSMTELAEVGTNPLGVNYRVIASTTGSYNVGSTGASANSSMIGAAFVDTGESLFWVPAPLTIDDSDSTFTFVLEESIDAADGVFWRSTLDDSYLIAGVEIRLGVETAGANTITVQGANEGDYSDAVTIATIPFTATGSYTAQDVTDSWTPTAVYRYWQLVLTTTSNVTVYEVALLDPDTGGGITDHGELDGLADDDHTQYVLTTEGGRDDLSAHGNLGTTEDIDPTDGNVHTGTLNADCTITLLTPDPSRATAVTTIEVYLTEDGTGGWDPTFAADGGTIEWPDGSAPTHDTTADTITRYVFETLDDGVTWYGLQVGSGGSSLTVEDEGTPLATAATTLDFVGAGVTASGTGAVKTITIPGATVTAADLIALGVVGPLLIADDHSTPIIFGDLLLTEDGDDFLYGDIG